MGDQDATLDLDARIVALAERQWGTITWAQLRELGAGPRVIERLVRRKQLHRLFRAVYAVGHRPLVWETWWRAAVFFGGDGAVLSRLSAGELFKWLEPWQHPIHVTRPGTGGRKRQPNPVVHRSRTLTPDQVTVHRGIPVTTPARTLLELKPLLPRWQWLRAVNQAEVDRLLSREQLDGLFPGLADRTRSDLERRFLAICRRHGIPLPEVNRVAGGRCVDAYWSDVNLAVEIDSWRYHGTLTAFQRDRRRGNDLTVAGVPLLRFTDLELESEPADVAARVKAARERLRG